MEMTTKEYVTDAMPLATSNPVTRNDRRLNENINAAPDRPSINADPIWPAVSAVVPNVRTNAPNITSWPVMIIDSTRTRVIPARTCAIASLKLVTGE